MARKTHGVMITGAGRGLGRAMALAFAKEGWRVAVTGRGGIAETARTIRKRGGWATDITMDLRDPEQIQEAVDTAERALRGIEVLVDNAAVRGPTAPLHTVSLADWQETLDVNLTGVYLCDRAVAPLMISRRSGCIIHVASVAGVLAYPLRAPYAASKWGLIGLSRTLAAELGPYNIRVNAVCPGPVEGKQIQDVFARRAVAQGRTPEDVQAEFTNRTFLKRLVKPQDVVQTVLFLASKQGESITGQAVRVDAGFGL